ncbi:hypothetical protein EJB05_14230 [Eragrostis curvula]|uniref:Uncharacterized protein n=1 Tax=Eragrostis curvula TaxID=38414 RepID=A0A5J9VZL6_9POAL|nr:hypothetical protein EJB05_14230 [Eragrostis curvula]
MRMNVQAADLYQNSVRISQFRLMATCGRVPVMAAAPVTGSPQGPASNLPAVVLPARKPWNTACFLSKRGFFRNHHLPQRGIVMDSQYWMLKAQSQKAEPVLRIGNNSNEDWTLRNYTDKFERWKPETYRDVLNTKTKRSQPLEELNLMSVEEREQHLKDLQQRGTDFMNGLIQHISSDKNYYKFFVLACKEIVNTFMEQGFISSYSRDEILKSFGRIQDDIEEGNFELRANKDALNYIVEALTDKVGKSERDLETTMIQNVQMLRILQLWCIDAADTIVHQIKKLQMDRDVCQLHRLSEDASHAVQIVMDFGNMIISDIAINLSTLVAQMKHWENLFQILVPHDILTEIDPIMRKHVTDLDTLIKIQIHSCVMHNGIQEHDSGKRFLAIYVIVLQLLEVATEFVKNTSFNYKKTQSFPPLRSVKPSGFSDFHTVKARELDQCHPKKKENGNEAEGTAMARHVFVAPNDDIARSDDIMKRLSGWLVRLQTGQSPLKYFNLTG